METKENSAANANAGFSFSSFFSENSSKPKPQPKSSFRASLSTINSAFKRTVSIEPNPESAKEAQASQEQKETNGGLELESDQGLHGESGGDDLINMVHEKQEKDRPRKKPRKLVGIKAGQENFYKQNLKKKYSQKVRGVTKNLPKSNRFFSKNGKFGRRFKKNTDDIHNGADDELIVQSNLTINKNALLPNLAATVGQGEGQYEYKPSGTPGEAPIISKAAKYRKMQALSYTRDGIFVHFMSRGLQILLLDEIGTPEDLVEELKQRKAEVLSMDDFIPGETVKEDNDDLLQKFFGHNCFLEGQMDSINSLLKGENVFCSLTVGGGKSLIYQYFSVVRKGLVVVVCPLLSLMQDQIDKMPENIASVGFNSLLSFDEKAKILQMLKEKKIKVLFITPELLLNDEISQVTDDQISLICIDEAHCMLYTTAYYRASFTLMAHYIRHRFFGEREEIETEKTKHNKIQLLLLSGSCSLKSGEAIISQQFPGFEFTTIISEFQTQCGGSFENEEEEPKGKMEEEKMEMKESSLKATEMMEEEPRSRTKEAEETKEKAKTGPKALKLNLKLTISRDPNKREALIGLLRSRFKPCKAILIFCATKASTFALNNMLKTNGFVCAVYNSDLSELQRLSVQSQFSSGQIKILITTFAFGMGINICHIDGIIHFHMPVSFEAYCQEIGRAGRKGQDSLCHVFLSDFDFYWQRNHLFKNFFLTDEECSAFFSDLRLNKGRVRFLNLNDASKKFGISNEFVMHLLDRGAQWNNWKLISAPESLKFGLIRQSEEDFKSKSDIRAKLLQSSTKKKNYYKVNLANFLSSHSELSFYDIWGDLYEDIVSRVIYVAKQKNGVLIVSEKKGEELCLQHQSLVGPPNAQSTFKGKKLSQKGFCYLEYERSTKKMDVMYGIFRIISPLKFQGTHKSEGETAAVSQTDSRVLHKMIQMYFQDVSLEKFQEYIETREQIQLEQILPLVETSDIVDEVFPLGIYSEFPVLEADRQWSPPAQEIQRGKAR